MNYRRKLIMAKIEGVYGTDSVPVIATDAVLVRNCNIRPVDAEMADRELVRDYLGHDEQIPVATKMRASFDVEMVGSGVNDTPPGWGRLLKACGFAETVNAAVSVVYNLASSGFSSLSMYYNMDGLLHKLLGTRGSVALKIPPRGIPYFSFDFTALYGGVSDVALTNGTMTAWKPPIAVNNANTSAFTLQGFAGKLYDLAIDLNNVVTYRNLVGGEDVQIVDRAPTGSIEIETPTVAAKDFWTAVKNGTLGGLSILHGVSAGFKVQVDAAAAGLQVLSPEYADRDGIASMKMGLRFVPTGAGNNELAITNK